jgi:hypothetical protein
MRKSQTFPDLPARPTPVSYSHPLPVAKTRLTLTAENSSTSPTGTEKEPMIRLGIYVKRHPSLTSKEFHEFVSTGLSSCF